MARKGKEADVQVFVKNDEEWAKLIEPQVVITNLQGVTRLIVTNYRVS